MHGGNERSDTCTAFFVLTLVKTRLRLSNQKGWANYPDGSRQLSNIYLTKLAIPSLRRASCRCEEAGLQSKITVTSLDGRGLQV